MAEDIETPELVELQDVFAKTESTVLNLPQALQNAILAKKDKSPEDSQEGPMEEPLNLDKTMDNSESEKPEDMFNSPVETAEPVEEFTPPVAEEPINPTPVVDTVRHAEIYAAHSLAQRVASMPLAEYEEWLFPSQGSPDNLRGQMCWARIDASLKAANGGRAVAELWQVKIGASLWSRLNFRDNPVEETRCELEKAPPMELIPLIPRNASEAISVIEEIQTGKNTSPDTNWGVIGACGVAVLLPILLLRRG